MLHAMDDRAYAPQTFDNLLNLDGISRDQIAEHLTLYAGYVRQVNAINDELNALRGLQAPPRHGCLGARLHA